MSQDLVIREVSHFIISNRLVTCSLIRMGWLEIPYKLYMVNDAIKVWPLSEGVGAELYGVELAHATEDMLYFLKSKCTEFGFLLVRNQDLSVEDQLRLATAFGQVMDKPKSADDFKGNFITSNGEILLHFDHWLVNNKPLPLHFTMLYAIAVTPSGGETYFSNVNKAYQNLPCELQRKIRDFTTIHCYNYSLNGSDEDDHRVVEKNLAPSDPRIIFPLVREHPDTGELTLYLSPRNTDRILELTEKESGALIEELFSYLYDTQNIYVHQWQPKDFLIWNNHSVLHGRKAYNPNHERRLRRHCVL